MFTLSHSLTLTHTRARAQLSLSRFMFYILRVCVVVVAFVHSFRFPRIAKDLANNNSTREQNITSDHQEQVRERVNEEKIIFIYRERLNAEEDDYDGDVKNKKEKKAAIECLMCDTRKSIISFSFCV